LIEQGATHEAFLYFNLGAGISDSLCYLAAIFILGCHCGLEVSQMKFATKLESETCTFVMATRP